MFSDSHGQLANARRALQLTRQVNYIVHAGDYRSDGIKLAADAAVPVKAVLGNCDLDLEGPAEEVFELCGRRLLLVHGHLTGAKTPLSQQKLLDAARVCGAEAVVYGHTHEAVIINLEGVLLFNPGSISRPLDQARPSYGILEINEKGIFPSIHRI
ncbi:MAG: Phosphodiesterase YfcE [Pelotomaculum sp. PtaB.Bin104]|nr:MAG: Phosphodiesterase YfcE [Pelotomaculum sp. PtaB.Bin104]